ncbi:MAG: UvrB/UvrC motif-containing protein [candidate division Zixibacteria bacterium]|nr:UvrB/UvrC motif-containing protein [candidate division Zixibacteria bacterium]
MKTIKCNNCGRETDRVVSITQVNANQKTVVTLCRDCAAVMGFHNPLDQTPFPLANILKSIVDQTLPPFQDKIDSGVSCSVCGLNFADFSQQGRFGCGACYNTFRPQLEVIMRKIHGGRGLHRGKLPRSVDGPQISVREQERLESEFHRAVELEEFERAADLRDRLREIKSYLGEETQSEKGSK